MCALDKTATQSPITTPRQAVDVPLQQQVYLEALHVVGLLMGRHDLIDVLHTVIQRAGELLGTPHGFINLVSDDGARLDFAVGHGACDLADMPPLAKGEGLSGTVWQSGAPLSIQDYAHWEHHPADPHRDLFHAALAVSLICDTTIIGVLGLLCTDRDRSFDAAALDMLNQFGELAAIALDNTRLYRKAQAESDERHRTVQRYESLFNGVSDVILVANGDGHYVDANPAALALLGYTRADLLCLEVNDLVSAPVDDTQEAFQQFVHTKHWGGEVLLRRVDGRLIAAEGQAAVIETATGPINVSILHDITDRKRAEASLHASEQHFRALIEHSSDGIALLGPDYTIRYASPSTTRILGYTPEEFMRYALIDLIHPDDRPRVARTIAAGAPPDGTLSPREVRTRHKDGKYRCLEYVGTVLFNDPTVEAIVVNYRDVTERKSVEATLWLRERAVAAATNGIVIADARAPDCPLIYVNAGFERLTGYTAAESLGRNCRFLQGSDTDPETRTRIRHALAADEACHVVLRNYRKDGTPFWNELVLSPVRDNAGTLTHFIGVQEDVSARVEADEALRASEQRVRLQYEGNPIATYTWQRAGDDWICVAHNVAANSQTSGRSTLHVGATAQDRFRILPDILADFTRTAREQVITEREARWTFDAADGSRDVCNRFVSIGPDLITQYVEDITERLAAEQERDRFFDLSRDLLAIASLDGRFTRVNPSFKRVLGYSTQELLATPLLDFVHPEDRAATLAEMAGMEAGNPALNFLNRYRAKDGSYRWLAWNAIVDTITGRIYAIARDVTEAREIEENYHESVERYRQTFVHTTMIKFLVDGESGRIVEANDAACAFYGYSAATLTTMTIADLDAIPTTASIEWLTEGEAEKPAAYIVQHRLATGTVRDIEVYPSPIVVHGRTLVHLAMHDITERLAAEQQLMHNALHDALTALPNRALFTDRVTNALQRAKRNPDRTFAVLFVDLDRFKTINDSLGHPMGDHLLVEAARRMQACLRDEDTIARFGGDEFAILLEEVQDVIGVSLVTEKIQRTLAEPIMLGDHTVVVSASIGIVLAGRGYSTPENVLRDADIAMYRAKRAGIGQHAVFDQAMHAQVTATLQIEGDLRQGLRREEFMVVYQPIVSLASGVIAGFEALIRWNHPQLGQLAPAEFVPVAEESGLIVSLDRWTLREACTQIGRWQRAGIGGQANADDAALSINVNLSARHFAYEEGLESYVMQAIAESGIAPAQLRLEITESALIAHTVGATNTLAQLRARGVQVAMDDFGVWQSSLSNLRRFPIDILKIDRSFIAELTATANDAEIIRAIVMMGRGLGMQVVAEGIETDTQRAQLQALGCEMGQGYLFGKPMNADKAGQLLVARAAMGGATPISP